MTVTLHHGDCLEYMRGMADKSVDLTVTSPPYDDLRDYNGHSVFDFEGIARELFRITADGGVVVWVVGDATKNGSETGTSLRQALYFMNIGFNLHDTMIYRKLNALPNLNSKRYRQSFEYMFVISKGELKTFNPITVEVKRFDIGKQRKIDGSIEKYERKYSENKTRKIDNIFEYGVGGIKTDHPATFPEALARDHIISWSNPGDVVFDCFMGSGTTGKMADELGRNFIGCEINADYFAIAEKRIKQAQAARQLELV